MNAQRMSRSGKEMNIDVFDDLFRGVWARIVPTLGIVNVRALLEHALEESRRKHQILEAVRLRDEGVSLESLRTLIKKEPAKEVEALDALREYLVTLVQLLAQLTGEVVSRQVTDWVHVMEKRRNIKSTIL